MTAGWPDKEDPLSQDDVSQPPADAVDPKGQQILDALAQMRGVSTDDDRLAAARALKDAIGVSGPMTEDERKAAADDIASALMASVEAQAKARVPLSSGASGIQVPRVSGVSLLGGIAVLVIEFPRHGTPMFTLPGWAIWAIGLLTLIQLVVFIMQFRRALAGAGSPGRPRPLRVLSVIVLVVQVVVLGLCLAFYLSA